MTERQDITPDQLDRLVAAFAAMGAALKAAAEAAASTDRPSAGDVAALMVLGAHRGIGVLGFAEQLRVAPTTASSIADRLEVKGYVCRVRTDADRRTVRLDLTPAGERVYAEALREQQNQGLRMLECLPADQVELFIAMMTTIAEGLHK